MVINIFSCFVKQLIELLTSFPRFPSEAATQEVFLGVLKICSKYTREHPRRSVISIKLQRNFIEITLRLGRSPVNLLHIFRTPFPKNISWWLLLYLVCTYFGGNVGFRCSWIFRSSVHKRRFLLAIFVFWVYL